MEAILLSRARTGTGPTASTAPSPNRSHRCGKHDIWNAEKKSRLPYPPESTETAGYSGPITSALVVFVRMALGDPGSICTVIGYRKQEYASISDSLASATLVGCSGI